MSFPGILWPVLISYRGIRTGVWLIAALSFHSSPQRPLLHFPPFFVYRYLIVIAWKYLGGRNWFRLGVQYYCFVEKRNVDG